MVPPSAQEPGDSDKSREQSERVETESLRETTKEVRRHGLKAHLIYLGYQLLKSVGITNVEDIQEFYQPLTVNIETETTTSATKEKPPRINRPDINQYIDRKTTHVFHHESGVLAIQRREGENWKNSIRIPNAVIQRVGTDYITNKLPGMNRIPTGDYDVDENTRVFAEGYVTLQHSIPHDRIAVYSNEARRNVNDGDHEWPVLSHDTAPRKNCTQWNQVDVIDSLVERIADEPRKNCTPWRNQVDDIDSLVERIADEINGEESLPPQYLKRFTNGQDLVADSPRTNHVVEPGSDVTVHHVVNDSGIHGRVATTPDTLYSDVRIPRRFVPDLEDYKTGQPALDIYLDTHPPTPRPIKLQGGPMKKRAEFHGDIIYETRGNPLEFEHERELAAAIGQRYNQS